MFLVLFFFQLSNYSPELSCELERLKEISDDNAIKYYANKTAQIEVRTMCAWNYTLLAAILHTYCYTFFRL